MEKSIKKGLIASIKELYEENTKTNHRVFTNKAVQDSVNATTEDMLCEVDDIDRIAAVEEALIELEQMIEEKE